ncbi:MAG: hypothetical protein JWP10_230 [Nocardioidaceae bacterium]|nr:hypothetical protein [Nocardioidaceae bacterium]
MPEVSPVLRISLSGIARLGRVQRPVVSMWRSRSAATESPFPAPIATDRGQELFDADAVATWMLSTGRGNNPDAVADAAMYATLDGLTPGDSVAFGALTALITLRSTHGAPLSQLDRDAILDLADEADPDNLFLTREVETVEQELPAFARFVDVLVDSAYGAAAAFESLLAERFRDGRRSLTRVALSPDLTALIEALAVELVRSNSAGEPDFPTLVDPTGSGGDLILRAVLAMGEDADVTVVTADTTTDAARLLRRRLLVHGIPRRGFTVSEAGVFDLNDAAIHIAQYPTAEEPSASPAAILSSIENIALQMDDSQRAIIVAPASVLVDSGLARDAEQIRASILRSGRVRALVRLPRGLVTTNQRQALSVWVLGPAHADIPLGDRWTMTADLSDGALTTDTRLDLVSDMAAAMGDRRTVRSHSFRFAHPAMTSGILARSGSLVEISATVTHNAVVDEPERSPLALDAAAIPARVDGILAAMGEPLPLPPGSIAPAATRRALPLVTLGTLAREGHVRCLSGTRIRAEDVNAGPGFTVIGTDELTGRSPVGRRTADRLVFADSYPTARLTEPGDVIFCTGATVRAWVDREGSSIVVYPARILRISTSDPAGLLSDVLAADVGAQRSSDWKRWTVRRIVQGERAPLTTALATLRSERDALLDRLDKLVQLTELLVDGVAAGNLTLIGTDADSDFSPKGTH